MMDSGAFSEISLEGKYTFTPKEYIEAIERFEPSMAVGMDWMCEPSIRQKTGLSTAEHQQRTIDTWLELKSLRSELPIIPVIQGWEPEDYLRHADSYIAHGCPEDAYFGIGSLCRRGAQDPIKTIILRVARHLPEARLHAFGINMRVYDDVRVVEALHSSDSMAWTFWAMYIPNEGGLRPCGDCHHTKEQFWQSGCSHCVKFGLLWRDKVLRRIENAKLQMVLPI